MKYVQECYQVVLKGYGVDLFFCYVFEILNVILLNLLNSQGID